MSKILTFHGDVLSKNGYGLTFSDKPVLPAKTIRLRYDTGVTPTFSRGTGTLVDSSRNLWDLNYVNSDWTNLLSSQEGLKEVIAFNTTGISNFTGLFRQCWDLERVNELDVSSAYSLEALFYLCSSLSYIPALDTSNVTNMRYAFNSCASMTSFPNLDTSNVVNFESMFASCQRCRNFPNIDTSNGQDFTSMFESTLAETYPILDTSKATNINRIFAQCTYMKTVQDLDVTVVTSCRESFLGCYYVESGALNLYQKLSTKPVPVSDHYRTFAGCGSSTQSGLAELNQIPTDWGGLYE